MPTRRQGLFHRLPGSSCCGLKCTAFWPLMPELAAATPAHKHHFRPCSLHAPTLALFPLLSSWVAIQFGHTRCSHSSAVGWPYNLATQSPPTFTSHHPSNPPVRPLVLGSQRDPALGLRSRLPHLLLAHLESRSLSRSLSLSLSLSRSRRDEALWAKAARQEAG